MPNKKTPPPNSLALYLGRFQPFHLGHFSVVKNLLPIHEKLIIGIGSAQYSHSEINPFTAQERQEMIHRVLKHEQIPLTNIDIHHIPDIHDPPNWVTHVKKIIPEFHLAYSGDPVIRELFLNQNIPAHNVTKDIPINATQIRKKIQEEDKTWEDYLHPAVNEYLHEIDGHERIKDIQKS